MAWTPLGVPVWQNELAKCKLFGGLYNLNNFSLNWSQAFILR